MTELIWSRYQLAIFEAIARAIRPLVCRARAGSAKTTTAVAGVGHVPRGKRVAMVAFNKDIAETLKSRVRGAAVSTFHSAGRRAVVRAFGELALDTQKIDKLCRDANVDWETRRAAEKVVNLCKASLTGIHLLTSALSVQESERAQVKRDIDELADEYGLTLPPGVDRDLFLTLVLELLEFCRDPTRTGTIDFEDMVWLPSVRNLKPFMYDVLFIDELQDMNAAQLALSFKMLAPGARVVACGDDRQMIYGFRGAQDGAVDWLADKLGAEILPLPICYRCDRAIVRFASTIVPDIEPALDAGPGLVDDVPIAAALANARPGDFVLSRSNASLISICLQLVMADKPARIAGRDIGTSLASFIKNSRCGTVEGLRRHVEGWKNDEVDRLAKEKRSPQTVIDKADCLMILTEGAAEVTDVLTRIETLFSDRGGEQIVCSTIHKAKGLEADTVWLLGESFKGCHYWAEKQIKEMAGDDVHYQRALRRVREENNILYVGITRARHTLHCVNGAPRPLMNGY